MASSPDNPPRIAVVGGGMAGLAAAQRALELDARAEVTLFEAGPALGGVLRTTRRDGFLIEHSADSFITNVPWAIDLCRRIGFAEDLVGTNEADRRALVVRNGKLYPVPEGFLLMQPQRCWPVLASPLLSLSGKLRMLREPWIPPRRDGADETLAAFVTRRLGREAFERLVQPLVGGIYTADPEQLSMAATMPRFQELERRHGSLIRAAWKEPQRERAPNGSSHADSGARYSLFVAPRAGMSSFVEALANAVAKARPAAIRIGCNVERLERHGEAWRLALPGGETLVADAVILALPAHRAARLLEAVDRELSDELTGIPAAGASIVAVGLRREQITRPIAGFGFVVPAIENRRILAASISSRKFPDRAPEGCELIRVFVGGALQPELANLPDDAMRAIVLEELAELLGVRGEPLFADVFRWNGAMPQYHLGHLERVVRIEARLKQFPGLQLAGNSYHGVGLPQTIHTGEAAVEAIG